MNRCILPGARGVLPHPDGCAAWGKAGEKRIEAHVRFTLFAVCHPETLNDPRSANGTRVCCSLMKNKQDTGALSQFPGCQILSGLPYVVGVDHFKSRQIAEMSPMCSWTCSQVGWVVALWAESCTRAIFGKLSAGLNGF